MKEKKKPAPLEVMKPGQVNEYWEARLSWRDAGDPRWQQLPYATKYSAEMYEKNRNLPKQQAA